MRHWAGVLLVTLVLLLTVYVGSHAAPSASPSVNSELRSALSISGDWVVKTALSYADLNISLGGNLTVADGGDLTLIDVTLSIAEPSNLAAGIVVQPGGKLAGTNLVVESATPAKHTYLRASADSVLELTGGDLLDLGGNSGSEQGLVIQASGTQLSGVTFDDYYQAVEVNDATNVHLNDLTFLNSTGDNTTYALKVSGTSSGFWLTNSVFDIPQDVGAIQLTAPNAKVTGNDFVLDPSGTVDYPILLGFVENGAENAAGSYFANNTVNGAGIIDQGCSNVTIFNNHVENTGINRPYGILGTQPQGTNPGLWVTGLVIEDNYITNYSRYGIRLELNVSHFLITDNTIVNPSHNPGPSWTVKFGGPQIDGIYIIRGISDGTVSHNYVDLSNVPDVASNGMTIESKVTDVKVVDNTFLNESQDGIVVQGNVPGFDSAEPWQRGPTSGILIANNLFENEREVQQTTFAFKGLLFWLWANHTTVENNTFVGFQRMLNPPTSLDGAAVVSASSYGIFENNTVIGARWGFVFTNYTDNLRTHPGEFNRSDNLVYNNHLYGIVNSAVDETPKDGMGPLHNVVDALWNTTSGPGLPSSYLESIGATKSVGAGEQGGVYQQSLRTTNPITGSVQTFTTSLPWSAPEFNVTSGAGAGAGGLDVVVSALNRTSVTYQVPATGSGEETVGFYSSPSAYGGLYQVKVTTNSSTSNFRVNSTLGPATFGVSGGSLATIRATLLSWWPIVTAPGNNTTPPSPGTWAIIGSVALGDGTPVANLSVTLQFTAGNGTIFPIVSETQVGGGFAVDNLSFAANLTSVTVAGANVTLDGYSAMAAPAALLIDITVLGPPPVGPVNETGPNNGTGPSSGVGSNPNGTGSPHPSDPGLTEPQGVGALSGNLALFVILDFTAIVVCLGLLGFSLHQVVLVRRQKLRRSRRRR